MNSATGAYGSKTWIFDGVGNRTFCFALRMPTRIRAIETNAGVADSYTPDRFRSRERVRGRPSPATNNKLQSIVRNAATVREFTPDQFLLARAR